MSYNEKELFNIFITLKDGTELMYANSKLSQPLTDTSAVIEIWENNSIKDIKTHTSIYEIACKPILENMNEVM